MIALTMIFFLTYLTSCSKDQFEPCCNEEELEQTITEPTIVINQENIADPIGGCSLGNDTYGFSVKVETSQPIMLTVSINYLQNGGYTYPTGDRPDTEETETFLVNIPAGGKEVSLGAVYCVIEFYEISFSYDYQ